MKISTKIMSALLAAMFAIMPLASCNGNDDSGGNTSGGDNISDPVYNEDGVELLANPIVLCDTNNSYYNVVRPDTATDIVLNCMRQICDYPKASGNSKLKLSPTTDWVKAGTDTSSYFEILIGNTNRPETRAIMETLDYDEYAITLKDNKIVVAAHNKETLQTATNFLCEKLLQIETDESGVTKVVFIGNYYYKSDKSFFFGSENPLSGYKIVCDKSSETSLKAANSMKEKIKRIFELDLDVVDDSDAESECEIVIGDVDRSICDEFLSGNKVDNLSFVVAVKDKKMLIGCTNETTIDMAVEKFCNKYVDSSYSYTMNFEKNFYMLDSSYIFADSPETVEGTDIRVMSFNVLCELWDDAAKNYKPRAQTAAAVIDYYAPHVVGLQEISDNYYKSLKEFFGTTYKFVDDKNTKGETNFSPLAYNTEKVTLKDHGTRLFSKGNATRLRLGSWAVFEDKATGKEFIVVNTHWDLTDNTEYRTIHSNEMAQLVNELKTKYNLPVITTGDYNTRESEEQYKNYVEKANLSEAKHTAEVIKRRCRTTHGLGAAVSTSAADSIDHIFGTSDVEFLFFNVLVDKIIIDASDHCPIYADIKLK